MFYFIHSTPAFESSHSLSSYLPRAGPTRASSEEMYYRHIAEEHQQYARLALARAQQEEEQRLQRAAFLHRQDRLQRERELYLDFGPLPPFFHHHPLRRPALVQRDQDSPFSLDQILHLERERRMSEVLSSRRQRDQEEVRRLRFVGERANLEANHATEQRDAIEGMVSALLGLLSAESEPEPSRTTAPPSEPKPKSPCEARCAKAAPATDGSDIWSRIISEIFAGIPAEPTEEHSQSSSCPCEACKRAPSSAAPASPPDQTAPASGGKGKGKTAEIPSKGSSDGVNQVGGYIFPSGLSVQEKQEIMRALGLTPAATSSQETTPSASTPRPRPATPVAKPAPRPSSLLSISTLETKFDSLKTAFDFPSNVDFVMTSPIPDNAENSANPAPSLAFTANNLPVNKYESELNELLAQLDEVESNGEDEVREKRKSLVVAVEGELESLDLKKAKAWSLRTHSNICTSAGMESGSLATTTDNHELDGAEKAISATLPSGTTQPDQSLSITPPSDTPSAPHDSEPSPSPSQLSDREISKGQEAPLSELSSDSESDSEEFSALLKESAIKETPDRLEEQVEVKGYELI